MKKTLLLLSALTVLGSTAYGMLDNTYGKFHVDFNNEYKTNDAEVSSVTADSGYGIGIEFTENIGNKIELGLGVSYEKNGGMSAMFGASYDSIPIYGIAKYKFEPRGEYTPFVKGYLGYSINSMKRDEMIVIEGGGSVKSENGVYYGIGAGFEKGNFNMELAYKVTKSELKMEGEPESSDVDYSRMAFSIGYKF